MGEFVIVSSGPLGIRNIREIGDVDIIVSDQLWNTLSKQYEVVNKNAIMKIDFPDGIVEAFCEASFALIPKEKDMPTIKDRIAQAEIIEGLPFEHLDNVLYFKRLMAREKDLKDIMLIEAWQKQNAPAEVLTAIEESYDDLYPAIQTDKEAFVWFTKIPHFRFNSYTSCDDRNGHKSR